jgi:predicted CXXCH cytochrome family protein
MDPGKGTARLPEKKKEGDNMKRAKLSLILVAAVAVIFGLSGISFAFHNGGVAECTGCHQMHNSVTSTLLVAADASSVCLNCHGVSGQLSFHVATADADMPAGTPPDNEGPGGDFGWLHKTYSYTILGTTNTTDFGQTHGHNIIAAGYSTGYVVDTDNPTAPGGTFTSAQLACTSCHDMHGKGRWTTTGVYSKTSGAIWTSGSYGALPSTISGENLSTGVYRMLRAQDTVNGVTFPALPPVAVANSDYNRSEFFSQTRTAYGSGMSDFCGTCHPDMHITAGIQRHPTGQVMSGSVQANYNSYVKTGNMTGSPTTSYLSLVPFEEGLTYSTANINTLKSHAQTDDSNLNGPGSGTVPATATIMCLSCHRAHASGWNSMFRWNKDIDTIIVAGAYPTGNDNGFGRTLIEASKAYYDYNVTKFSAFQRQLCNKCHAMD